MRLLLFLLFSIPIVAQKNYPTNYFRSPLDIPMQLAGNFGELRPNHFHAGFDFKTNQKEGLNIYATGDGYVARIKISTAGYGKAIYINHPNGYTTVYGHLQKATGSIEKKIKEVQYKEEAYEVEIFLKPNELPVKKGDIIALSGNTGGSEGPHLHFEFRDTATEKAINPIFFGFDKFSKDTKKPTVNNLVVYPIDNDAVVNKSKRPVNLNLSLQADGTYLSEKVLANGKIGFAVGSVDTDNVSFNNNGVYKTQLLSNGKPIFGYEFNEMAFDEGRFINAFIDYPRYKKAKNRVQKLFMKQPYSLSNITQNVDNGIINVTANFSQNYKIEASDFYGNKTIITIPVVHQNQIPLIGSDEKKTNYFFKTTKDVLYEKDNVSVYFPEATFYEDFYMNFDVKNDILYLHDDTVAAHLAFTMSFETKNLTETEKSKTFIAAINGTKLSYLSTKVNGNTFSAKSKYLGQFKLAKDITNPKITIAKPIQGKWISDQKTINLSISDDLSGVKTYNGYLNGKWILFEYESKLKRLTHHFNDGIVAEGNNILKVVVVDNVGNSTTFETQFFRSQK